MYIPELPRGRSWAGRMESLAKAAILVGVLATSAGAGDARSGRISHTLKLPPGECVDLEFLVPRGQYDATLDVSRFPPECAATDTLSMTAQFYSSASCLYYDETRMSKDNRDGCVKASATGDICHNWPRVQTPFNGNFTVSEHHCSDVMYFAGFKSTCLTSVELNLVIEMSDLDEETREFCQAMGDARRGLNELFYLVLGMMIGLPMVLVALGATCCCCFLCPNCPGHKLVSKDPAVVPMGYHLISAKSNAAGAPSAIVVQSSAPPENAVAA